MQLLKLKEALIFFGGINASTLYRGIKLGRYRPGLSEQRIKAMTDNPLPRANRDRWSDTSGVSPADAQRIETEAKRHGLDPHVYEMSRAIPTDLVQALVRDGRSWDRGRSAYTKPVDADRRPEPPLDPIPLSNPPGISMIDRMVEEQSRREYEAEIARRLDVATKLKALKDAGSGK
jgi:hypothetical protein